MDTNSHELKRHERRWEGFPEAWSLVRRQGPFLTCTAFALALVNARWWWSGHFEFFFLVWNLFLAWIPLGIAGLLDQRIRVGKGGAAGTSALLAVWVLFLPNAPYLLTDVLHWRPRTTAPAWFDLLLLLHFAMLGLLLGFASLRVVRRLVAERFGSTAGVGFTIFILPLASFGVYLGRYQRWNSWDLLIAPYALLADVGDRVFRPWEHPRTWGFTLGLGLCLLLLYWLIESFGNATRDDTGEPARNEVRGTVT